MLSIVTINRNNAAGLEKTIVSIANQDFKGFQYIVIDGDSNDGSKELLENYAQHIDKAVSEPDTGIYNAMNKGLSLVRSDYVLFLNSGDTLHDNGVMGKVQAAIDKTSDLYYGNLWWESPDLSKEMQIPQQLDLKHVYLNSLPHPATFIRTALLRSRPYNEDLRLVSDWQFFLESLIYGKATAKHLGFLVSRFDGTGLSNDPAHRDLMKRERQQVITDHFNFLLPAFNAFDKEKALANNAYVQQQSAVQLNKTGRKIHLKLLRLLEKLFKDKRTTE